MLFSSIFAASSDRSPDSDFWFTPIFTAAGGRRVSADQALSVSAVFACVRIIAETIGSLPCITYRRLTRGKERATDHPMYELLRYRPNERQTALEFFEMMTAHVALRGNGYAEKVYRGPVLKQLVPLHPDSMRVDRLDNGRLGYLYTDPHTHQQVRYLEDEILHVRGLSLDGLTGVSVLTYAARTISSAAAADEYGAKFFENDATPGGILKHPSHFANKEIRAEFAKAWQQAQSGRNRGKTAVLEDGMSFEQIGLSNADAQFIESRRWGVEDICRIFRVPLVLVGETTKSTSWGSGVEQFMISFITHTMRPWFVRWEQALQRDFLADEAPDDEYFVEFLAEAMLRGDTTARGAFYKAGIVDGWLTRNEVRERENLNPLDGLDEPLEPLNMTRASDPRETSPARPPAKQPPEDDDAEDDAVAHRINRKEIAAVRRAIERNADADWLRRFYSAHESYVRQHAGVSADIARTYCEGRKALLEARIGAPAALQELLGQWEAHGHEEIAEVMR